MKYFIIPICVVVFGLYACVVISIIDKHKESTHAEKTITLTRNQLMNIYENGYLKGEKNSLLYKDKVTSNQLWQSDSLYMTTLLFDK